MIPKLEFQFHDVLVRTFLHYPFTRSEKREFKRWTTQFKDSIQPYIKSILQSVEELSDYKWNLDKIPVYLIPPSSMILSFAKPVLEYNKPGIILKVFENTIMTINIFIHEVVHVNQMQSEFWDDRNPYNINKDGSANEFGRELCADIVTIYIIRRVFKNQLQFEKEFWDFLENTSQRNRKKFVFLRKHVNEWKLDKKPLRLYLK